MCLTDEFLKATVVTPSRNQDFVQDYHTLWNGGVWQLEYADFPRTKASLPH